MHVYDVLQKLLKARVQLNSVELADLAFNDWHKLIHVARNENVLPLISASLLANENIQLPDEIRLEIQSYQQAMLVRNLYSVEQLDKILNQLKAKNISSIILKGPILSARIHGEPYLRYSNDLDLLINVEDVEEVIEILEKAGFSNIFNLKKIQRKIFIHFRYQLAYINTSENLNYGIHWHPLPTYLKFAEYADLIDRRKLCTVDGKEFGVLSPEDELLYLCGHGFIHKWDKISYSFDIASLLYTNPNIDWDVVVKRAAKYNKTQILTDGLWHSRQFLNKTIPLELIKKGHKKRWLNLESINDKRAYFIEKTILPTGFDCSIITLPRSLYFLYYPIRIINWVIRMLINFLRPQS